MTINTITPMRIIRYANYDPERRSWAPCPTRTTMHLVVRICEQSITEQWKTRYSIRAHP